MGPRPCQGVALAVALAVAGGTRPCQGVALAVAGGPSLVLVDLARLTSLAGLTSLAYLHRPFRWSYQGAALFLVRR
jgi:hypothetical protein